MRKTATSYSFGPQQSLRTCVGGVVAYYWRERKARTEGDDAAEVPSTEDRIPDTTPVQELLAFSDRKGVVHAGDPALAVVEVRETFLCGQIVAVLRPRRVAAESRAGR